mgnify:CR=1 FL=1|jgi:uncharacterized membrane protein YqjE
MIKKPKDRRAKIFMTFSGLSLLLVEAAPDDFRWVGLTLCIVYIVLAIASWLDLRSRTR